MARYSSYGSRAKVKGLKVSLIIVSVLSALAIVLSCITSGFTNWNTDTWFGHEPVCEHVFEDGECTECGELEVIEDVENDDVVEDNTENESSEELGE